MQCTLAHNSTKLELRVDLVGVALVEPIRKFDRGNECRVMCAVTIAQTYDSQQKFTNVRLVAHVVYVSCSDN